MIASWWMPAVCLAAVGVAVVWPAGTNRRRLMPARAGFQLSAVLVLAQERLVDRPRQAIGVAAATLAGLGWLVSGVVAGVVAAVYGALALRALARRSVRKQAVARRARSLDDLAALAADLRAGLPPAAINQEDLPGGADRIGELTRSVWRLAERTGAPAAELVERIEADARADDRAQASAAAQSAGAQATALLLAALPAGGIALGYSIGVDPLQTLLHTSLGGLCALGAAVLQTVGLLWADRLTSGPQR